MSGLVLLLGVLGLAVVAALLKVIIVRERSGTWIEAVESAARAFRRTLSVSAVALALYVGPEAIDVVQRL
ncbi:hypothetical protein [Streptomyces griseomycini]|uniref:Uncharacterized protein n=1 Tax=Streptomyces griseomycini TaxID=66895 RepID=A0A7W7LXE7_9ACTN|nr:hypothetical protein [Streptomyces griseomycini]MBB4898210.1 hypothetical protein [Streptomyces griseomycini]GGQ40347.1 hypothetical protein GCM10010266_74180 [Streptomyces griseomycini]GGR62662.1 hypothetical protein GCM10015536_77800 [Streptomyces griseomycini]